MKKLIITVLFIVLSFSIVYAEETKKVNLNELKLVQQIFTERKDKLDAQMQNLQLTFKDLKKQYDDAVASLKQVTDIIKEEEVKIVNEKKKLEEENKKK